MVSTSFSAVNWSVIGVLDAPVLPVLPATLRLVSGTFQKLNHSGIRSVARSDAG
jgi:hypothetical protein